MDPPKKRRRYHFVQVITPSIVSDRMKIRASLARGIIKQMAADGKINLIVQSTAQMVYTRAIKPEDKEEEIIVETPEKEEKKGKKKK